MITAYKRKEVELVSIEENVAKQSSTAARPSFDFVLLSTRYLSLSLLVIYLDSLPSFDPKVVCLVHLPFRTGAQATKIKKKRKAQK